MQPIFEYAHSDPGTGAAWGFVVIGGVVVRASDLPNLEGRYIYIDNAIGDLRSFTPTLTGAVGDASLGLHVNAVAGFGKGPNGQIYLASLDGPVYHLREGP